MRAPGAAKRRRGAQPGNRLAQTHGARSREMNALRLWARALIRGANAALAAHKAAYKSAYNGAQGDGQTGNRQEDNRNGEEGRQSQWQSGEAPR